MKLVVIVPCYNEEATLPAVLTTIPRTIAGVDEVRVVVVDDGSTDRTSQVAHQFGADTIVRFRRNRGLAAAFAAGMETALSLGADIIVNTDGDNQYPQAEIPCLIEPILEGRADIVIADRRTRQVAHFSKLKKMFQWLGSWTVRRLSSTDVPDATCGFRAYSRQAALSLNIVSEYTYTTETIIQAGNKGLAIQSIVIATNPKTRESRLFANMWEYIWRSAQTIVRVYAMYRPMSIFTLLGGVLVSVGFFLLLRFLYFYLIGEGGRGAHIQSLILAAILAIVGFQTLLSGLQTELVAINRRLLEDIVLRLKQQGLWKTEEARNTSGAMVQGNEFESRCSEDSARNLP